MSSADGSVPPLGLFLSSDLMFGSRVGGGARQCGGKIETVLSTAQAVERLERGGYRLLIVDLETPGLDVEKLAETARKAGVPTVGYASHVREAVLQRATDAGFDEVHPRSRFAAQVEGILARSLVPKLSTPE